MRLLILLWLFWNSFGRYFTNVISNLIAHTIPKGVGKGSKNPTLHFDDSWWYLNDSSDSLSGSEEWTGETSQHITVKWNAGMLSWCSEFSSLPFPAEYFNTTTHMCCGKYLDTIVEKPSKNHSCCGKESFDKSTSCCTPDTLEILPLTHEHCSSHEWLNAPGWLAEIQILWVKCCPLSHAFITKPKWSA